jgi:hypothetical protein
MSPSVSRGLGERWNALSEDQRLPYVEAAQVIKMQHQAAYPSYKYSPRRKAPHSTTGDYSPSRATSPRTNTTPNTDVNISNTTTTTADNKNGVAASALANDALQQLYAMSCAVQQHLAAALRRQEEDENTCKYLQPTALPSGYSDIKSTTPTIITNTASTNGHGSNSNGSKENSGIELWSLSELGDEDEFAQSVSSWLSSSIDTASFEAPTSPKHHKNDECNFML